MRIVFMGTPEFSVPSLQVLAGSGHQVVGVFTQPDRPKGRGNKLAQSPVKTEALRLGIPVFQPQKIRKDGVETLRELAPDLCITAAFGQILNEEVLSIPPEGNINVHASLLPRHRGAAPIAYAIMQGDEKAGVTTMMMDAGIDTGDILMQKETAILPSETCGELTARLSIIGAELLLETLKAAENHTLRRIPQKEEEMTYDPMLKKTMGRITFSQHADRVAGLINGLNPWPCVTVGLGDQQMKLLRARTENAAGIPGTVLAAGPKEGLVIACDQGAVRILELQAPGSKIMKAEDYFRGHTLQKTRISDGE